jgi:hypothetical protein
MSDRESTELLNPYRGSSHGRHSLTNSVVKGVKKSGSSFRNLLIAMAICGLLIVIGLGGLYVANGESISFPKNQNVAFGGLSGFSIGLGLGALIIWLLKSSGIV